MAEDTMLRLALFSAPPGCATACQVPDTCGQLCIRYVPVTHQPSTSLTCFTSRFLWPGPARQVCMV